MTYDNLYNKALEIVKFIIITKPLDLKYVTWSKILNMVDSNYIVAAMAK